MRPQSFTTYLLSELPAGTKYRNAEQEIWTLINPVPDSVEYVEVLEWPKRFYNHIPADDLDALLDECIHGPVDVTDPWYINVKAAVDKATWGDEK